MKNLGLTRSIAFLGGALLWVATGCVHAQNYDADEAMDFTRLVDKEGNRVPDFSYAGYRGNDVAPPEVPAVVHLAPLGEGKDDGDRIQAALDYVARLPLGKDGFRGAVQLEAGTFSMAGQLKITASGVVLRGMGAGKDGTVLLGTGTDRRALIRILGTGKPKVESTLAVDLRTTVAVGAMELNLEQTLDLVDGDMVRVRRASTQPWIDAIGMRRAWNGEEGPATWRPGQLDIVWDREVRQVAGNKVMLDAPLTMALDRKWGGASVERYSWPGRISNCGVEDVQLISENPQDQPNNEEHAWDGVIIENARDCWVARLDFRHFTGSAVAIWETASRVTVQDCKSFDPDGEAAGWRRHIFFTAGGQVLFLRCFSDEGRHEFSTGPVTPGPVAFVHCTANESRDDSGPIGGWSTGVLYDNVNIDGAKLKLGNIGLRMQFAGWTAANCVLWQCTAAQIDCYKPVTAQNWAIGCWAMFEGDGQWRSENNFVRPKSLMQALTARRLGPAAGERIGDGVVFPPGSTNPTLEQAKQMVAAANGPAPQLTDVIDRMRAAHKGAAAGGKDIAEVLSDAEMKKQAFAGPDKLLKLENGWLTVDDAVTTGGRMEGPYWRGGTLPTDLRENGGHITRFVPGRMGRGYTDDLDELTSDMLKNGTRMFEHYPPLWYDRRNDDHERVRRLDSEAWPPFYEYPWERSGKGQEWDRLSKYDLTMPNKWYFMRLNQFATLAREHGLVLFEEHYMQHNIIEAGAHWASYPWRSANNVNNTGFPEPPPYSGDKRIMQAHLYYDVTKPALAALHRGSIRSYLDLLGDQPNVLHATSSEFTGTPDFTKFWVQTIGDWEAEKGKKVITVLSAPRNAQDAVLADPKLAATVDVIDINYWWYQENGTEYAPPGGENLSVRQWSRMQHPRNSSFLQVARAVREYRDKYPGKGVMYSANMSPQSGWAVVLGGGSLPANLPGANAALLRAIPKMKPTSELPTSGKPFGLEEAGRAWLCYVPGGQSVSLPGAGTQEYEVEWIGMGRGRGSVGAATTVKANGTLELKSPSGGEWAVWAHLK